MIGLEILNKLAKDRKKIILIILVVLIFLYLDFSFFIGSQLKGIKKVSPKIINLKADLNNFAKESARIKDLKDKQPEGKPGAPLKVQKFIADAELPSLLKIISEIANKNTVKIIQIKPAREVKAGGPAKATATPPDFSPLLITLGLVCDYHHFGKFLNELENAEIFLEVEGMKISSQPLDYFQQKVNLVVKTYVKK